MCCAAHDGTGFRFISFRMCTCPSSIVSWCLTRRGTERIADLLRARGARPFLDVYDIEPLPHDKRFAGASALFDTAIRNFDLIEMLMQDAFNLADGAEIAVDVRVPIVDEEFAVDACKAGAGSGDDAVAGFPLDGDLPPQMLPLLGDIAFGYPILDLTEHRRDVRWYVAQLEEVMIRASADLGISAKRVEGRHGVWIETPMNDEKLGALGVHLSRWVTSHGFAYNVSTDPRYFDLIVPCGIPGTRATSLERILNRSMDSSEVRARLASHFADVFELSLENVTGGDLSRILGSWQETTTAALTAMV